MTYNSKFVAISGSIQSQQLAVYFSIFNYPFPNDKESSGKISAHNERGKIVMHLWQWPTTKKESLLALTASTICLQLFSEGDARLLATLRKVDAVYYKNIPESALFSFDRKNGVEKKGCL